MRASFQARLYRPVIQAAIPPAKVGPASVELPRQGTAVAKELEGDWEGDMTAVDHNVHVRLTLANQAKGPATARLLYKGRQEAAIDIGMVTQYADLLTLESAEASLVYDARIRDGEISGTWQQGPYEFVLVFHRVARP